MDNVEAREKFLNWLLYANAQGTDLVVFARKTEMPPEPDNRPATPEPAHTETADASEPEGTEVQVVVEEEKPASRPETKDPDSWRDKLRPKPRGVP